MGGAAAMTKRKMVLREGAFYHVFSKSIAGFEIFRCPQDYRRIVEAFCFYQKQRSAASLGLAHHLKKCGKPQDETGGGPFLVRIVAYCVMPTHIHLLLEPKVAEGASEFMRLVLNSYTRYFNLKIGRLGPLWASRFKSVSVDTDEQLLHLTRYIHLNPSSAGLVGGPSEWEFSSYSEYAHKECKIRICDFDGIISLAPAPYSKFVENGVDYQRSLQIIKSKLLD